ncbi:CarD family transcriptional regulator [Calderihabitans maritimus]|uniref:CarD family transcriptional regulator n=1 Tax=Calderihabitans maritimus TaxID=1246530 RepID=A0A1Z5HPC9_9FIRM|nr:CarD family transcriptional regulator [Calderihabitans maritimus]GAW91140.1 CarD family transcriptional regulator [Calderihabitans maritimus]
MFKVGDKVVYPMHGAGIIEAIEEKEVLGQKRKYYVMHIPIGDMKVMIPIDSVEEVGLRQVIDEAEIEEVLKILKDKKSNMSSNWNKRYRTNMEKIKSGNIFEVAEVVRNLILREQEKGLSTGERRMLENARQILISELVLARGEAEEKVESLLEGMFA